MISGRTVEVNPLIVLGVIFLFLAIYGLPILWLLSKTAKKEFIDQNTQKE